MPKESACLDYHPDLPLDVPHAMMNKFRGYLDGNFQLVSSSLKELVEHACNSQKRTQKEDTPFIASHDQTDLLNKIAPDVEAISDKEGTEPEYFDESSGQWFKMSDEYQTWWGSSGGLMWCPGVAGSGKTVLADIVFNDLYVRYARDDDKQVIRVFFDYIHTRSPKQYLASLWKQLAMRRRLDDTELATLTKMYFRKGAKQGAMPREAEWKRILSQEIRRYSKVFLIIDALDESKIDQPLQFVEELVRLLPMANILVTTRPDLRIQDSNIVGKVTTIEIQAHKIDLERYLEKRVSNSKKLRKAISQLPELKARIKDQVLENSKGM